LSSIQYTQQWPFFFGETPNEGSPTLSGFNLQSSLNRVLTDGSHNTEILGDIVIGLSFPEHIIVNRKEPFAVAINQSSAMNQQSNFTSFQEFTPTPTGTTDVCGFSIGAVEIDLSDFGIPSGVIQPRFA